MNGFSFVNLPFLKLDGILFLIFSLGRNYIKFILLGLTSSLILFVSYSKHNVIK